jgi:hypothetical protein
LTLILEVVASELTNQIGGKMIKSLFISILVMSSSVAMASEATCYGKFNNVVKASFKTVVSHSLFGDYNQIKMSLAFSSPNFAKASGKSSDKPSDDQYYFRSGDGNIKAIVDAAVVEGGSGSLTYMKPIGKNGFTYVYFNCN